MIRLLAPEDFALWKAIRLEALKVHPDIFAELHEEAMAQSDEGWAAFLQKHHIFVYLDNDIPVGVGGYFYSPAQKMRHRGKVFTNYVSHAHRGHGIMDWLLSAIAYHARDNGVEQLHLDVVVYNKSAIHCYERNGYTIYGTEPRIFKMNGDYCDCYVMVKYL